MLRKVNLSSYGNNRIALRKIIDEYDLDLTKISENRRQENLKNIKKIQNRTKPLEEVLVKNSIYKSNVLLNRLVSEGYKEMKCECCGITDWMGKPITFQLHHKDGDHLNNELENLECLCPNCHTQTDNYAGKGKCKMPKLTKKQEKRKAQRGISEDGQKLYDGYGGYKVLCPVCKVDFMNPNSRKMCRKCFNKQRLVPKVSKEELFKIMETNSYYSAASILGVDRETVSRWHKYYIKEEREKGNVMVIGSDKTPPRDVLKTKIRTMSFVQIGKEYDVTDNSVKRWCDRYKLPRLKSIIKTYSDEEWEKI